MTMTHEGSLPYDALAGLWSDPPTLPARWFYDDRGSHLFEEITQLPEYYPTRRETELLTTASPDIAATPDIRTLIDLGSGSSIKTRLLLDALTRNRPNLTFVPVDVSGAHFLQTQAALQLDYPRLVVDPCLSDFHTALQRVRDWPGPRLVIFLGSTIGNLTPADRRAFLRSVRTGLQPGDQLLLGADLVKSPGRLTAAYDDRTGITAAFNRNLIEVLRRELDAVGLYPDDFEHVVRWRPAHRRIEMWLRTRRRVQAYFKVLDREWVLGRGAEVLTEICTKFVLHDLQAELTAAGFTVRRSWTDHAGDYSLTMAQLDESRTPLEIGDSHDH
jgi:L-histidine N-alpha-methyltransferase